MSSVWWWIRQGVEVGCLPSYTTIISNGIPPLSVGVGQEEVLYCCTRLHHPFMPLFCQERPYQDYQVANAPLLLYCFPSEVDPGANDLPVLLWYPIYMTTRALEAWAPPSGGCQRGCLPVTAACTGRAGDACALLGRSDSPVGLSRRGNPGSGNYPCCAWGTGRQHFGTDNKEHILFIGIEIDNNAS